MNGSLAMSGGKYDVLLFAEHDLYAPALEPKHQMYDHMCVMNKGTMTRLNYNTNNGAGTKWNQYGGTGMTLNADMRARVTKDGWGGIQQSWRDGRGRELGAKMELLLSLFQHTDRVTTPTAYIRCGNSKQGTLKKMKTFETQTSTPYSLETCASSWVTSVTKAIMWC